MGQSGINWTEQLENQVIELIENGEPLRAAGQVCGISAAAIIRHVNASEDFAKRYARAKEVQMELMAQEILDIADDTRHDTRTIKRGELEIEVENGEWINRCRLQVDTRKWIMSKLAPKKYGDSTKIVGDPENPVQFVTRSILEKPE